MGFIGCNAIISSAVQSPSPTVVLITDHVDYWPLWPNPIAIDNPKNEDLKDPFSFTTVGRELLNWVDFEMPLNSNEEISPADVVWGMTLSTIDFSLESPDIYTDEPQSYSSTSDYLYYFVSSDDEHTFSETNLTSDLETYSVIPSYLYPWGWIDLAGVTSDHFANQPSETLWRDYGWEWINFIQGSVSRYDDGTRSYYMADSGNGTPYTLYPDNGWLMSLAGYSDYVSNIIQATYDSGWGDAIVLLNSNEGLLRFFNVSGSRVVQELAVMPSPAFKYSIYQDNLQNVKGYMPRITLLDGPVTVNDIQKTDQDGDKDDWMRIAVGTLGMGQELMAKPSEAWNSEVGIELSNSAPDISGHFSGIYAFDITDVKISSPRSVPPELWSVSTNPVNSSEFQYYVNSSYDDNPPDRSSYTAYGELKHSPTRPIFGYTVEDNGDKTWHTIIAAIDTSDMHRVYDINALNGSVFSTPPTLDTRSLLDGDIVEDDYPTRIATSIPLGESTPLLSDVYFHLSEGSFYHWDIVSESTPEKLFKTIYADPSLGSDNGIPSGTDFDVAEIDVGSELHKMAAVVVDVNRAGEHDQAKVLVVVDLDEITSGVKEIDLYNGISNFSAGDWTSKGIDTVYPLYYNGAYTDYSEGFMVWLGGGLYDSSSPKRRDVAVSSPIFYDGKVVLSVFQWKEESSETSDYESSVYAIDVANWTSRGSKPDTMTEDYRILDGGGELVTFDQEEFIGGASIVDTGSEVIFNTVSGSEGKNVNLTELLGVRSITDSLGSSYEVGDMFVSYWKVID